MIQPGDTVRWFRGKSGIVLEGVVLKLLLRAGEKLPIGEYSEELGPYPTDLYSVRVTRTLAGRPWPHERDQVWNVTEAEMRFEVVRPLVTLEEARLTPPVFDEHGNMIGGGCLALPFGPR